MYIKKQNRKYWNEGASNVFKLFKIISNRLFIIYADEIKLLNRVICKDKEEIIFFMNDFKIPFTNNNALVAQRGIKIK